MTDGRAFDIAGICAHPDDAELVMGGTLAAEASRGRRVALVDLTRGESGSRGTPETRAAEAREAAAHPGRRSTARRWAARTAASRPAPSRRTSWWARSGACGPRVVMLQHWEQRHPDHAAASRIVYDASFLAGLKNYRPSWAPPSGPRKLVYALSMTESDGGHALVRRGHHARSGPRRCARSARSHSQFTPAPGETVTLPFDRFQQAVELAARRQGRAHRRASSARASSPGSRSQVDDLLALKGRSI